MGKIIKKWNIYFVRHGQTDRNIEKKMNPWDVNSLLNQTWIIQAINCWKEIKKQWISFDIIISSPLKRALKTAELIKKEIWFKSKIKIDKRLEEQYAWILKNYTHKQIKSEFNVKSNEEIRRIFKNKKYNEIEDIMEFSKRVTNFYNEIKEKYKNKDILIVSHTWVSRIIFINSEKRDFEKSVYKIRSIPNATIIKLNNEI